MNKYSKLVVGVKNSKDAQVKIQLAIANEMATANELKVTANELKRIELWHLANRDNVEETRFDLKKLEAENNETKI